MARSTGRASPCAPTAAESWRTGCSTTAAVRSRAPRPPRRRRRRRRATASLFITPRAAELVPLAEALREAGVGYRLAEQAPVADGAPVRYAIAVEDEDAAEALRVLGSKLVPADHGAEADALETRFAEGRGYVECPACGARQPEGASECPECGLGLGGSAAACARCSAPLPEPDADCPACGASPPR